jgi:hypothetical protein
MNLLYLFGTDDQVVKELDHHFLNLSSGIGQEVFAVDRQSLEN